MTHRLLIDYYTVIKRHLVPFFFVCDSLSVLDAFLLVSEVPVDDLETKTTTTTTTTTTNGKEMLENLLKLNFHVLLKLKRINLETSVYI